MKYCLPTYSFRLLDRTGWNFRYAKYHEENRRTLIKTYGIKFLVSVNGKAGKFDLKNTVILLVTGLGLLGLANILCDFVLLHCSNRFRKEIQEKKYEAIQPDKRLAENLKSLIEAGDPSTLRTLSSFASITLPPGVLNAAQEESEINKSAAEENVPNEEIKLSPRD